MISAGVEGRLPYMTYPDPYRGPPKQPPEFLRPAPKPLPSRYNGLNTAVPNGTRMGPPPRTPTKYSSPPAVAPVNLTQHKEDTPEELPFSSVYSRLFSPSHPHFSPFTPNPYTSLYQPQYAPLTRSSFVHPPPLSPLETYSPTTPTAAATTFLPPPSTFSPPAAIKPSQPRGADKKLQPPFKVPSGKEGSLKHRILTRPEDGRAPLDLQKTPGDAAKGRLTPPPRSPSKKTLNNNTVPGNFAKGSLIQLANGELRRVEDMRTEDFVSSAEQSPELRLADSTVVRVEENPVLGSATITLSYNQRRAQVEIETTLEHPFFVYGQGWASCNPDRTLHCYGLKVHRLQVGDVLISLTPREPKIQHLQPPPPRTTTIITTATTTAVTARQISAQGENGNGHHQYSTAARPLSPDLASRKRRWSAPDDICDDDEQIRRHRNE